MSAELIGILAVGATLLVGLGGLILILSSWVRGDIRGLALSVAALERGQAALERGQARLEGLIEGSGLFRTAEASESAGN